MTLNNVDDKTFQLFGETWGYMRVERDGIGIAYQKFTEYFYGPFGSKKYVTNELGEIVYYIIISLPLLILLALTLLLMVKKRKKLNRKI